MSDVEPGYVEAALIAKALWGQVFEFTRAGGRSCRDVAAEEACVLWFYDVALKIPLGAYPAGTAFESVYIEGDIVQLYTHKDDPLPGRALSKTFAEEEKEGDAREALARSRQFRVKLSLVADPPEKP